MAALTSRIAASCLAWIANSFSCTLLSCSVTSSSCFCVRVSCSCEGQERTRLLGQPHCLRVRGCCTPGPCSCLSRIQGRETQCRPLGRTSGSPPGCLPPGHLPVLSGAGLPGPSSTAQGKAGTAGASVPACCSPAVRCRGQRPPPHQVRNQSRCSPVAVMLRWMLLKGIATGIKTEKVFTSSLRPDSSTPY